MYFSKWSLIKFNNSFKCLNIFTVTFFLKKEATKENKLREVRGLTFVKDNEDMDFTVNY